MAQRSGSIVGRRRLSRAKAALITRQSAAAIGLLAALQGPANAYSASATATLNLYATVTAQCYISNATLNFGSFGVFTSSAVAANTISANAAIPLACTNGLPAALSVGLNPITLSGTATTTNQLVATLYQNAANTSLYPTATASGVPYVGGGSAVSSTIYGQIITSTQTKVDTYTGSTTLTISY